MKIMLLLLAMAAPASASDVPFYLRSLEDPKAVGALNENFRSIINELTKLRSDVDAETAEVSTVTAGSVVQVAFTSSTASGTGTKDMVWDNTKPQITEGDQILASTMTPVYASSKLLVRASGWVAEDTNVSASGFICALFRDATADAIAAKGNSVAHNGEVATEHWAFDLETTVAANAATSTVFSLRCGLFGAGAGATLRWNGVGGASILGGAMVTQISITEIKQ